MCLWAFLSVTDMHYVMILLRNHPQSLVRMLQTLQLYVAFEHRMLLATRLFYRDEALTALADLAVPDYLLLVMRRMTQEV